MATPGETQDKVRNQSYAIYTILKNPQDSQEEPETTKYDVATLCHTRT